MDYVIGLDFGNCYTYASTVDGMNERREGGIELPLMDSELNQQVGIPSRFFYDRAVSDKPLVGMDLELQGIRETQGINMLKRHIHESFTMGGKTFAYIDAITEVVQHAIREANKVLRMQRMVTTKLVSLAYPVTFSSVERQKLVQAVERATLEDGTHVEVVGTIVEPAAAALEYLTQRPQGDQASNTLKNYMDLLGLQGSNAGQATSVLVYDLGGGTFDATILSVYPQGMTDAHGNTFYYHEHLTEGIGELGGEDFSAALQVIIEKAIDETGVAKPNNQLYRDEVARAVRETKHALSRSESYSPTIAIIGQRLRPITRAEFEKATLHMVKNSVDVVTRMLDRCDSKYRPEMIILTGGASKMPMVRRELLAALKPYGYSDNNIAQFRPSDAISFGAARFGVVESNYDVLPKGDGLKTSVQQHVRRSIGIRVHYSNDDSKEYIDTLIPAGTALPYLDAAFATYVNRSDEFTAMTLPVYEATVENPDRDAWGRDWRQIGTMNFEYGCKRPKGYKVCTRLVIDLDGTLRLEAYDERGRNKSFKHKDIDWKLD